MDSWDSSPSDLSSEKSKWVDEDVEECTLDSWEQVTEEKSQKCPQKKNGIRPADDRPKRGKKDICAVESEEAIDKVQAQKLQEESDLCLAKEVFGVTDKKVPESKEDFSKLNSSILQLISSAEKNAHFFPFAEDLVTSVCAQLSPAELKKICVKIGNLQIQKSNAEKGEKKKAKTKLKAKLRVEGEYAEYSAYTDDYGDDFI